MMICQVKFVLLYLIWLVFYKGKAGFRLVMSTSYVLLAEPQLNANCHSVSLWQQRITQPRAAALLCHNSQKGNLIIIAPHNYLEQVSIVSSIW